LLAKENQLKSLKSQVFKFIKVIKLATFYESYENFYFTYQVDFRGRIYAVSDFLNYQSDKLSRNLIYFSQESSMNLY
jgi:DNA-directed RNA polymerase